MSSCFQSTYLRLSFHHWWWMGTDLSSFVASQVLLLVEVRWSRLTSSAYWSCSWLQTLLFHFHYGWWQVSHPQYQEIQARSEMISVILKLLPFLCWAPFWYTWIKIDLFRPSASSLTDHVFLASSTWVLILSFWVTPTLIKEPLHFCRLRARGDQDRHQALPIIRGPNPLQGGNQSSFSIFSLFREQSIYFLCQQFVCHRRSHLYSVQVDLA